MRGFSTLEAVLSLLILSLLLALSFPSFQLIKTIQVNHQTERRESLPVDRTVRDLARELRAVRSLHALPPQILTLEETSRLARRRALSPGLLLAAPAPEQTVIPLEFSPYRLCTTDPQWRASKGWLGVSVDGFSLLRGRLSESTALNNGLNDATNNTRCRGATFIEGAFTELGSERAPPNLRLLFPLRELTLFYLSEEGTVRRLSLLTGEHQPIISGITRLSFELAPPVSVRPLSNQTASTSGEEIALLRITVQKGEQERSFLEALSPPVSPLDLL